MENCIFCKIIKGEIPSSKIFENEEVLIILDTNPLSKGHCLVISKNHFDNIFDIDKGVLSKIIKIAKKLSGRIKNKLGATGVNLINSSGEGSEGLVSHFHLHIIPRYENDGLEMNKWWQSKVSKSSPEDLQKLTEKLKVKT